MISEGALNPYIPTENVEQPEVAAREKQEQAIHRLATRDWQDELSDLIGFSGNVENGAKLMGKYVEGMVEVYEIRKEQNRMESQIEIPDLGFSFGDSQTYYNPERNAIYIAVREFSEQSKRDPATEMKGIGKNSEVTYEGTLENNYLLSGAEEMTHALDTQREKLPKEQVAYIPNDEATSVSIYDSSDLEYRGLGIRVVVAKRKKLPQETQDVLQTRLLKAIEERQKSTKKN